MHVQLSTWLILTVIQAGLSQDTPITDASPVVGDGGVVSKPGPSDSVPLENKTETFPSDSAVQSLSNGATGTAAADAGIDLNLNTTQLNTTVEAATTVTNKANAAVTAVTNDANAAVTNVNTVSSDSVTNVGTPSSDKGTNAKANTPTGSYVTLEEANVDNHLLYLDPAVCEACTSDLIKENQCILPHSLDCRKYIHCVQQTGKWTAYNMKCGHGTFWSREKNTCDQSDRVQCKNDFCKDPSLKSYPSSNDNCRAYMECYNGLSVPACCKKNFEYVGEKCIENSTCTIECPDPCQKTQLKSYANPENCRNYKECKKQVSHSMCCPEGYAYIEDKCVVNDKCTLPCPKDAKVVEVAANSTSSVKEEPESMCPGVPIKDGSTYYIEGPPKQIMSCPGTLVYSENCVCDYRKKGSVAAPSEVPPPTGCKPFLCIDFEKNFTTTYSMDWSGVKKKQANGIGKMDGNSYIAIFHFNQNEEVLKKFQIKLLFKSSGKSVNSQVLLSNCRTISHTDSPANSPTSSSKDDILSPSLAIILRKDTVFYFAKSKTNETVEISHKFKKNQWTSVKITYDGERFSATTVPVTKGDAEDEHYMTQQLTGGIIKGIQALRIGKCGKKDGFVGELDDVCFSNCLTLV